MTVTPRRRTTKQNLDPRCTYVPTRVKTNIVSFKKQIKNQGSSP
jgi:hypothetical protein